MLTDVELVIRAIRPEDDPEVARVIRTVMPEFGADGPGFAIHDAEVGAMHAAYTRPRSSYFVVADGPRVVGGGGVAPLAGADPAVCELKKMYFLPEARGRGVGRTVLERCLEAARAHEYRTVYLETLSGMKDAQRLYEKLGFQRITGPMGSTGHFGCNTFYTLAF
jgi:putative acetyltransferase